MVGPLGAVGRAHEAAGMTISRPRLSRPLGAALGERHVAIIAPAGSGKTVLLDEALALAGFPSVRVRCRAHDSVDGPLTDRVLRALVTIAPEPLGVLAEERRRAREPLDPCHGAARIVEELDLLAPGPLVLVLDDAEHVVHGPAARIVETLLEGTTLRVAVASRATGDLRLARLRAQGRILEIGAAELAFDADECAEAMTARGGVAPSDEEIAQTLLRTGGWALGIALDGAEDPEHLSAFLGEAILDGMDEPAVTAALRSAVPDELSRDTLDALGLDDADLAAVRAGGLPMRRVDAATWEHHPLVRDALLERIPREERAECDAALGAALAATGRTADAVEHWLAAGDRKRAADGIAIAGRALLARSPGMVRTWLDRLGPMPAHPGLAFLRGRLALGSGDLSAAEVPLREAIEGSQAGGDEAGLWLARAALADTLFLQRRFTEVVPLARDSASPSARTAVAAPFTALTAAAALARLCRFEEAREMHRRAADHPLGASIAATEPGFLGYYVHLPAGRLDAALTGVRDAVAALERDDPFGRLPYLHGLLALVHEERGEDDEAEAAATTAVRLTEETVLGGHVGRMARALLASILARRGRTGEAEVILAGLTAPPRGWLRHDVLITRATLAAAAGDRAGALASAEAAIDDGTGTWLEGTRTAALLAAVLAGIGAHERAVALLDDVMAGRSAGCRAPRLAALRAWLRREMGDHDGARAGLLAAWREAGDERVHLLRREWHRLIPLLEDAVAVDALPTEDVAPVLADAAPSAGELLRLSHHDAPAVRRAAIGTLAATGHPEAAGRVADLARDTDPVVRATAARVRDSASTAPAPLAVGVLGPFTVRRGRWTVTAEEWQRPAASRLFRYLLLHRDRPVTRDEVLAAFWPAKTPDAAAANLRVTLRRLRLAIDGPSAAATAARDVDGALLLALPPRSTVDADEFLAASRRALDAPPGTRREALEHAAALWTGPPLPEDRYEDWAVAWRAALDDRLSEVLAVLGAEALAAGDHPAAIAAGRRAVAHDPLDEAAHRAIIVACARAGRTGHALRQFLACRRALVDELGVEPGPLTTALHARVLAGEPV